MDTAGWAIIGLLALSMGCWAMAELLHRRKMKRLAREKEKWESPPLAQHVDPYRYEWNISHNRPNPIRVTQPDKSPTVVNNYSSDDTLLNTIIAAEVVQAIETPSYDPPSYDPPAPDPPSYDSSPSSDFTGGGDSGGGGASGDW